MQRGIISFTNQEIAELLQILEHSEELAFFLGKLRIAQGENSTVSPIQVSVEELETALDAFPIPSTLDSETLRMLRKNISSKIFELR